MKKGNLDISMAKVFPCYFLFFIFFFFFFFFFFRFQPSSGGSGVSKLDLKCKLWMRPFSIKTRILQKKNLKHSFYLLEYYLWWKCWRNWTIFGGARTQNPPKRTHFMNAELVSKTLKIFNFTTRNTIVIKLTRIMCLHAIFSLTKNWGVTKCKRV